ncbi:MAG: hypothetical protein JO126_04935 [Alphaproteobacteria bacterium]|nr:hypothetical protein [Alphaproteobacteria bacterium]
MPRTENQNESYDRICVLSHSRLLTKKWLSDGTIEGAPKAKYFGINILSVRSFEMLVRLLQRLQTRPCSAILRGMFCGWDNVQTFDPSAPPKRIRRTLGIFTDQPLHAVMFDVDDFETTIDPTVNPQAACEEFARRCLPPEFQIASYFWRLSSSAGHPSKDRKLRAHIWFWLKNPATSGELKSWARRLKLQVDTKLFNPVQIHFTANPLFESGVVDPVPCRSGVVCGIVGDEVEIVITPAQSSASRLPQGFLKLRALPSQLTRSDALRALKRAARIVAQTPKGERNHQLYLQIRRLNHFLPDRLLIEEVARKMSHAASVAGLSQTEIIATVVSALSKVVIND